MKINNGDPAEIRRDYILKVEVKGNNIKCYVDGKLEIDMDDDNNPFKKGAIGVGTFNAEGHFDDVIVDGKGIPPSPVSPIRLTIVNCQLKHFPTCRQEDKSEIY